MIEGGRVCERKGGFRERRGRMRGRGEGERGERSREGLGE